MTIRRHSELAVGSVVETIDGVAFSDGARFEGVGIARDLQIVQQAADLRETSDRVLNGVSVSMSS